MVVFLQSILKDNINIYVKDIKSITTQLQFLNNFFIIYIYMGYSNGTSKAEKRDEEIKLHHKVFCENWYKIDHDPITI